MTSWEPSASLTTLQQRASIIRTVREFFYERQVLEVDTPTLSHATVTDPFIDSFHTIHQGKPYFLQTSPEYAMKRLLAAHGKAIYQISKAFRVEENGSLHNPEFSLLEWYRPQWHYHALIKEVDELFQATLNTPPADIITYHDCFQQHLQINPHSCDIKQLANLTHHHIPTVTIKDLSRDDHLNLLLTHLIEPQLGNTRPVFIIDYPASQAALATIRQGTPAVAERFELYYQGVELANGFQELQDKEEQLARFHQDQQIRQQLNKPIPEIDTLFLNALKSGLPSCAGVALGLDRLILFASQKKSVQEVMSFSWDNA